MATTHYDRVAITLHWLMGLSIILMLFLGLTMEEYEPISRRFAAINFHKALGITLLALAVFRLVWRLLHKAPPLPDHMNKLEKFAANASHVLLYFFMIAIPLSGWLFSSAYAKYPIHFFGLFQVPFLPIRSVEVGKFFVDAHEWLAYGLIGLLVAHVLAALKHHFYDRDDVLTHMVPILKRR
jgi:cytochrome b561